METKIDKQRMEKVRRSCGFMNGIEIEAEGSHIKVTLRSFSKNNIDVMVKEENINAEWRFTGFYGSPYVNCKNDSWTLLRRLGEDQSHPWLVKGDFNEIMYTYEKVRGLPRGYSGVWFTWERGNFVETNIKERLDRGVANEKWKSLFPIGSIHHLPQSLSDHCPLLLNTVGENIYAGNSQFKLEAWWITKKSLEEEIKSSWESTTGTILEKLEKLQEHLNKWARSIKRETEGLKRKLTKELEMLIAKERDDDTIAKIIETRVNLNMEIDRDEIFWEQRARANWLKVGDKNSTFFHKFASSWRKRNTISRLQLEDGGKATEDSKMAEVATLYFQKLFMSNGIGDLSHLLQGIEESISQDTNAALLSDYTEEEVFFALKGMGPTKAPGPDGFSALFFQRYWHIVGTEVINFCLGILNNDQSLGQLNSTDIILIPKTQNPASLLNFRPISLCTVLYKIVAKAIANRFQAVIGGCIDAVQSAFVPGRLISDNVLLAYEILNTFRQKRTGKKGYMAVKPDMSKAYDKVEWGFLKEVMMRMGFAKKWMELILKFITTASYVININGKRGRVFQATRGLRQDDPLSPFLF
ncbi:reverse transcriptase [Gossypium australe]|uniref:Reverse transcriptase n=1 Tax=Gossypium australe TaxID=47621 RepID=A0A5B6X1U3_9ROSI|nr:reverse transcriptase [Gossypium australe]